MFSSLLTFKFAFRKLINLLQIFREKQFKNFLILLFLNSCVIESFDWGKQVLQQRQILTQMCRESTTGQS